MGYLGLQTCYRRRAPRGRMEIDHEERGARRSVAKSKWSSGDPIRAIRWILGPPTPIPQSELPKPTTSTRLSFTVATHSSSLHLDPLFTRMTRSLRLKRVLIPFLLLWATANVLLIRQQYYRSTPPIISCDAPVWDDWPPDVCGLNVTECADELVGGTYRCMGGCRDASLGNPRWIGGEEIDGVPLIIGGGDGNHTYR